MGDTHGQDAVAKPRTAVRLALSAGARLDLSSDGSLLAIAPGGRTLATAGNDGTIRLYDVTGPQPLERANLTAAGPGAVYSLAFDADGSRLVAGGAFEAVALFGLDPEQAATRICDTGGAPISTDEWNRYLPSVTFADPCRPRDKE